MIRKNPFNSISDNINNNNNNDNDNNMDNINNYYYNSQLNYPEKNVEDTQFEIIKHEYYTKIKHLNSSPNFITSSSEILPSDEQTLSQLNIPISISISPFNNSNTLYELVPLVDYGSNNIPRCKNQNCSAFLNPFIKFIENGEKWICNFCGQENDTEDHYFCDLDKNGERLDVNTKTELCCGSYEFKTNKSYWKKNKSPTRAFFIFVLETSLSAIDSGFLSACVESIKDAINNDIFYNGDNVNISIITYNTNVDFYSYGEKFTQPQMLSVVDDPAFLPTSKINLVLNVDDDKEKILQILDLIQNTFNRNNANIINNNCKDSEKIFSALNGAFLLGNKLGAKIIIFSSSNIIGNMPKMNGGLDKNATKEQIAYSCHDVKKLETMGINLTNENMSVDIFLSAEKPTKLLTLYQLCEYTNGNLYFFKKFNIDLHYKNIFNQIRRVLSRPICWEGLNKLQFSNGLTISNYITPVLIIKNDLFVFPNLDSDQNFLFNIGYKNDKNAENNTDNKKNKNIFTFENTKKNNNNNNSSYVYIQSSLLYSYGDGQRRIRVHNLCLPTSNNPRLIYENMNAEIIASYYLKLTNDKLYKNKNLASSIIFTDTQFKFFIDKLLSNQNKIKKELPGNLEYLPLYMIGLFKHRLYCKDEIDKNYDIDTSNFLRTKLQKLSTKEIISYICPSIYYLNDIETNEKIGEYDEETGMFSLPPAIGCTKADMKEDGLYLIDNGYLLILYIRKKIASNIIQDLFGVSDLSFITMIITEDNVFAEKNKFKEKIMNIIDYIREGKSLFQNLIFVFEGSGGERIINESLIEDNNCQWFPMNYEKFYHKYIQESTSSPFNY
jgi:protein transport protein SEC24